MLLILMKDEYMTGNSEDCAEYCLRESWLVFCGAKERLP